MERRSGRSWHTAAASGNVTDRCSSRTPAATADSAVMTAVPTPLLNLRLHILKLVDKCRQQIRCTVNLEDLEQLGVEGGRTRVGAPIRNSAGDESHFLIIDGPRELVQSVFAGSDFDITIESGETREDWEGRFQEVFSRQRENGPMSRGDIASGLFKPSPESSAPDNSLAVILHQIRPGGTGYFLALPFSVPRGVSAFFVLPPVCTAAGVSLPTSGDPDLSLMLSPAGPILDSSTLGGLAPDSVLVRSSHLPAVDWLPPIFQGHRIP